MPTPKQKNPTKTWANVARGTPKEENEKEKSHSPTNDTAASPATDDLRDKYPTIDELKKLEIEKIHCGKQSMEKLLAAIEKLDAIGTKVESSLAFFPTPNNIFPNAEEGELLSKLLNLRNTLCRMHAILAALKEGKNLKTQPLTYDIFNSFVQDEKNSWTTILPDSLKEEKNASVLNIVIQNISKIEDEILKLSEKLDNSTNRTIKGAIWHEVKTGLHALFSTLRNIINELLGKPTKAKQPLEYTGSYNKTFFTETAKDVEALQKKIDSANLKPKHK